MNAFMDVNIWMIVGFLLAAYSVVANDSLQTLGTYISSNKKRTPKAVQMLFICTVHRHHHRSDDGLVPQGR